MKRRFFLKTAGAAGMVTMITPSGVVRAFPQSNTADAKQNFILPSNDARPGTFWFWLNGNVTKEGITLDLEAMHRMGLGVILNFDAGTGIPKGPVDYLSDKWFELKAHAINEAHRLGMDYVMHNCPGWTSSGGPWITPELAMQELTWSKTDVRGGKKITLTLAKGETEIDYYNDIAVLAYPKLADSTPFDEWERRTNRQFNIYGLDKPAEAPNGAAIDTEKVVNVSEFMASDGKFTWDAPVGEWTILRLGYTPTGRTNNSAPDTGIGLECDKYSAGAIEFHFKNMMDILLPAIGDKSNIGRFGLEIDSWEVGMQNWTKGFEQIFKQRAGYDLTRYLPAMTGHIVGDADTTDRFLWDVRRIQADLLAENYYGKFTQLCHENGMLAMVEPYDRGPMEEMQIGAPFDMCMGEFWFGLSSIYQCNKTMHRTCKLASSIAHTNGHRYVGAESFSSEPASAKWQEYPFAMKSLGDKAFTNGINRIVIHRYAQQPHPTALPGMTMGAWGIQFDRTTTWWEPGKAWVDYLARCQALLQQGNFSADLAYFTGESGCVYTRVERSDLSPSPATGYDYDLINSETLINKAFVNDKGHLALPNGMTYKLLMLQDYKTMSLPLLRKVHSMVSKGLTVVGAKPESMPGLRYGSETEIRDFNLLCSDLWGGDEKLIERKFGKGRVLWGFAFDEIMRKAGLTPDFICTSESGDAPIRYIHRTDGDTDIYFVSNQRRKSEEVVCSFRVAGKMPELWNPVTGKTAPMPIYRTERGRTFVPLCLDPSGSAFVVFKSPATTAIHTIKRDNMIVRSALDFAETPRTLYPDVVDSFTISLMAKPEIDVMMRTDNYLEYVPDAWTDYYAIYPPSGEKLYGKGHRTCGLAIGRNGVAVWEHGGRVPVMVLAAHAPISGWSHIALVYTNGVPAVYVNGLFIAKGSRSSNVHPGIGKAYMSEGASYYNGDMTKPKLLTYAANEDELKRLSTEPFDKTEIWKRVAEPAGDGKKILFWENGSYKLEKSNGKVTALQVSGVKPPTPLTGEWEIAFPPKTGAPAKITVSNLQSLHKHHIDGVKYFSGTATYLKSFALEKGVLEKGRRVFIDLGQVEIMAELTVNGKEAGCLWTRPYMKDITDLLKPGENRIKVSVTNLWPNRLIGDEFIPDPDQFTTLPNENRFDTPLKEGAILQLPDWYKNNQPKPDNGRVTFTTWKHYHKTSPLLESGLVGPVVLRYACEEGVR